MYPKAALFASALVLAVSFGTPVHAQKTTVSEIATLRTAVSFKLAGNELLHSCPEDSCPVVQYGTFNATAEIKEKQGSWYRVVVTEQGYAKYTNGTYAGVGILATPVTTQGWYKESVIPKDIVQKAIRALIFSTPTDVSSSTPVAAFSQTDYILIGLVGLFIFYKIFRFLIIRPNLLVPAAILVVAVASISAASYFGFNFWNDYSLKQAQAKEIAAAQIAEREVEDAQRDQELQTLQGQVTALKNKPPEIKTITVESKDPTADIVAEWSPRVVYIQCEWAYSNNGAVYARASGSATLINYNVIGIRAVTNKHVLLDQDKYVPKDCLIVLPGVAQYSVVNDFSTTMLTGSNEDWGYVKITPDNTLINVTKKNIKICSAANVNEGDKLLVLGYPGIGSQTGVTVTEGIVSGYDGNYYITSAKIDHGNSGGAAILVKDDCYLGIPSASVVGSVESLGRILKASFVAVSN